ncbi:FAD-dependent oxidoreductase domain-containing protein 1 [Acidimicrobiaceae bacterium]|nr:FAD-dependent oxidoreductase domain-containing protein 1 [Acidimicrobiaceae bacterium]
MKTDVVVIGAGVIGGAVALELAKAGRSVVIVDKGSAAGAGSTSASSAIIRFSYSTHDAVLMAWESASIWENWADYLGAIDPDGMAKFIRTGYLVYRTAGYDGEAVRLIWDDLKIPYEILSADQLRKKFPALDANSYWPPKRIDDPAFGDDAVGELSGLYDPLSGFMDDPMLAAHNLINAAKVLGAQTRFKEEVVAIDKHDSRVTGVTLASGERIEASIVVNAAGPHASKINKIAGVLDEMNIRHRPLRQEVYVAPAPNGFKLEDNVPVVADLDTGIYFRPHLGGTINLGGTEPACDELHWIDDADDWREETTVEIWETMMLRLARRMPDFGVPVSPSGIGALYDATDDWVPIYDRSSIDGFFMACGTSGNQFKNAPLAATFIRLLIEAGEAGRNHDTDPISYVGPRSGRAINLGAFSRLREVANTSGTVMG